MHRYQEEYGKKFDKMTAGDEDSRLTNREEKNYINNSSKSVS